MPHRLAEHDPHSAVDNPMTGTLRYRCGCANNEVITISVVFDAAADEERFLYTMRQAFRDLRFEIKQHIAPPRASHGKVPVR